MADASVALNHQSIFAAVSPRLISISPVLSRIQSPMSASKDSPILDQDVKRHTAVLSTSLISHTPTEEVGNITSRPILQSKMRKKNKIRRAGLHQINGEVGRNLHSLKVTIRRTSQSHKIDPAVCTVIDSKQIEKNQLNVANLTTESSPPELKPSFSTPSFPASLPTSNSANGDLKVDACTSTTDCATLTEPDLLGPCEAGTKVVVEGVVWLETAGMLVLNVQWRDRAYMGTLMDVSKQNFGPCMDKGVVSALSLLRGRRGFSHCSPGRLRNRGASQYHRRRSSQLNRNHALSASVTTRSAAAAAAFKDSSGTSSSKQFEFSSVCPSDLVTSHSNPSDANDAYVTTGHPQRGAKHKRKRGAAAAGRPYRRMNNVCSSRLDTVLDPECCPDTDVTNPPVEQSDVNLAPGPPSPASFPCPYSDCEKTFCDLISMRYHFALGHSAETDSHTGSHPPRKIAEDAQPHQPKISHGVEEHLSEMNVDIAGDSPKPCNLNLSTTCDNSTPSSPPPPLGRAHSTKGPGSDSNDNSLTLSTADDAYDNLAPPRLHRIVSLAESVNSLSQRFIGSSPKQDTLLPLSPELNDEPPAPSPAYSDISDDGTVPVEQTLSFIGTQNKLIPNGQVVLSSGLGQQLRPPIMELSDALSRSVSSPTPTNHHNGFYFPINMIAPTLPTSNGLICSGSTNSNGVAGGGTEGTTLGLQPTSPPYTHRPLFPNPSTGLKQLPYQLCKNICTTSVNSGSNLPTTHIPGVHAVRPGSNSGTVDGSKRLSANNNSGVLLDTVHPPVPMTTTAMHSGSVSTSGTWYYPMVTSTSNRSGMVNPESLPLSGHYISSAASSRAFGADIPPHNSTNVGTTSNSVFSNQFATVPSRIPYLYRQK